MAQFAPGNLTALYKSSSIFYTLIGLNAYYDLFFYGTLMLQEKNLDSSLYFLIIIFSLHLKPCERKSKLDERSWMSEKMKNTSHSKTLLLSIETRPMERFSVKL